MGLDKFNAHVTLAKSGLVQLPWLGWSGWPGDAGMKPGCKKADGQQPARQPCSWRDPSSAGSREGAPWNCWACSHPWCWCSWQTMRGRRAHLRSCAQRPDCHGLGLATGMRERVAWLSAACHGRSGRCCGTPSGRQTCPALRRAVWPMAHRPACSERWCRWWAIAVGRAQWAGPSSGGEAVSADQQRTMQDSCADNKAHAGAEQVLGHTWWPCWPGNIAISPTWDVDNKSQKFKGCTLAGLALGKSALAWHRFIPQNTHLRSVLNRRTD